MSYKNKCQERITLLEFIIKQCDGNLFIIIIFFFLIEKKRKLILYN